MERKLADGWTWALVFPSPKLTPSDCRKFKKLSETPEDGPTTAFGPLRDIAFPAITLN